MRDISVRPIHGGDDTKCIRSSQRTVSLREKKKGRIRLHDQRLGVLVKENQLTSEALRYLVRLRTP
jgi:hypothetical protein